MPTRSESNTTMKMSRSLQYLLVAETRICLCISLPACRSFQNRKMRKVCSRDAEQAVAITKVGIGHWWNVGSMPMQLG